MTANLNYTRHLPHLAPEGCPIFVTWNLKGAMPVAAIAELKKKREGLETQPPRPGETSAERSVRENKILFAAADQFLDQAVEGPMHLKDPRAARIVEDAILFGVGERYELFAWCVMSNRVHIMIMPGWRGAESIQSQAGKPDLRNSDLPRVMKGLKGYTAHQINEVLDTRGHVFWQDESYDHWARDEDEMLRIIQYIENNPTKARLCLQPEDWPWSSARFRGDWRPGEAFEK
jgi:putative transposase